MRLDYIHCLVLFHAEDAFRHCHRLCDRASSLAFKSFTRSQQRAAAYCIPVLIPLRRALSCTHVLSSSISATTPEIGAFRTTSIFFGPPKHLLAPAFSGLDERTSSTHTSRRSSVCVHKRHAGPEKLKAKLTILTVLGHRSFHALGGHVYFFDLGIAST